ncbi:hypothetical protein MMC07_002704, partial [Pseudocyphellaria aurata]|nr:hypothetical protein [Pseudocyphellaria aurata]
MPVLFQFHWILKDYSHTVIELFKRESCTIRNTAPIAYFYCVRNISEPERADPDEIMRSILKQLSCSKPDIPIKQPVVKAYGKRIEEAENDGCDPEKLTVDECVQLTLDLLENDPAIIVIDALDECDPTRRHEVLAALDKIIHSSANLVKVFVSSRDDNDIVYRLVNSPNVYIHATDNREDICRFVHTEVDQCIKDQRLLSGIISQDMKSRIISTLIEGAQGMFRWVTLQIENLCDFERIKHEGDIDQELGRLPMTLKLSYDVIFRRIEKSGRTSWSVADSVMRWLLCAQRTLTSMDLIIAVSVNSAGKHSDLSVPQLLHMCCNTVVLDTELDVFRFAHLSVREYIECREEFNSLKNHAHAMERCLNTFIHNTVSVVDQSEIFRQYSSNYWAFHCQHLGKRQLPEGVKTKLQQFLVRGEDEAPVIKWALSVNQTCESIGWDDPLKDVLREALSSPPNVLFLACCLGLSSIVDLLDTFTRVDWNQQNSNGNTALHLTVAHRNKDVVDLLLQADANVDKVLEDRRTVLHLAVKEGQEKIVELLLHGNSDVNKVSKNGRTALQQASYYGNEQSVMLLLKADADINKADENGWTALHLAAGGGHEKSVELLLKAHADVKKACKGGMTALHLAASRGHEESVELLLKADPD